MHRRSFLAAVAALGLSGNATAQRAKMARVGLMLAPPIPNPLMQAFQQAMRELGYVEGKNLLLDARSAEGRSERFPAMAADLVRLDPDVIVAGGGVPSVRAAMKATSTIPIVFPSSNDPVGEGLVKSLTRPGGNVTGHSNLGFEISAKRVQLLKEMLPRLRRVALFQDPTMRTGIDQVGAARRAADSLGIELLPLDPKGPEEYAEAFAAAKQRGAEALIVLPSSSFSAHRRRLIELAAEHKLPTVWEHRLFTDAGGVVSYGPDFTDLYRGAARYVDKILKGAKPTDLPVEQVTKLELVINLKAAKAQGIGIPGTLLVRADRVIQ